MDRREDFRGDVRLQDLPPATRNSKRRAEHRLRRRRAQTNQQAWVRSAELCLEPWTAGPYFGQSWLLVDAALSSRLPLEVLHGIGHVDITARNPGISECLIQERTGWPDEWFSLPIFLITGLFADEHDVSAPRSRPEHHLCRRLVEVASAAFVSGRAQGAHAVCLGNERRRTSGPVRLRVVRSLTQCRTRSTSTALRRWRR